MRKWIILLAAVGLLAFPVSGLAQIDDTEWVCPEGFEGQTLRVFNWSTYIAEKTVPVFEEKCKVQVEYFEFGSEEEMINIVRSESAQYDIVVPLSSGISQMIEEGLLQPLDHSKIPNLKNLIPKFTTLPYDPNNEYSVPYQWGTLGIAYDKNVVEEPITTFEDFLNYEGRVAWIDEPRVMLGMALTILGYDANTQNEDEINEAAHWLLDTNRSDVFDIAADIGQDLLVRGEVDAVIEWNGDIFQIIADCECDDFVYVVPEDAPHLWNDGMVIPFNAPNPDLAHAFIDYILDPHVGADLSNFIAYATPNYEALPYILPELRENIGIYPPQAVIDKAFTVTGVGDADQYYSQAWNMVNAEINQ